MSREEANFLRAQLRPASAGQSEFQALTESFVGDNSFELKKHGHLLKITQVEVQNGTCLAFRQLLRTDAGMKVVIQRAVGASDFIRGRDPREAATRGKDHPRILCSNS